MSETVTPWKFRVEGEAGLESDGRTGAGSGWAGDRGRGQGDATTVHGGVQAQDRSGGRRVPDAGGGRGVTPAGGAGLLAPHDPAGGTGAGRTGRGAEEARPRSAGRRAPRPKARPPRTGAQPRAETPPPG